MRLPNPQGKGKGAGTSTWYDATGKLALLWVPGQNEIDLLTECLICFHDRFYTIDEISVLVKAAKSNQHEFTILQYDGEKHCVDWIQEYRWKTHTSIFKKYEQVRWSNFSNNAKNMNFLFPKKHKKLKQLEQTEIKYFNNSLYF